METVLSFPWRLITFFLSSPVLFYLSQLVVFSTAVSVLLLALYSQMFLWPVVALMSEAFTSLPAQ